ncbi:hypothetical protein RND71_034625 [Anisodus tanguticus]|uniref:Uncharacterized protein n=1 Tax=Anisodus tanguticus TaxID=243964 RepID=A0AAE1RAJ7_9SOLA|nr:hypothetical protein RND71_034625 [Anisodus tanguticus]
MIGRADIEGSKSNVAMNAWRHKPLIPVVTFLDTSSFEFRRSKGSLGHAFTPEPAVRRPRKAPEGAVPVRPPAGPRGARSRRAEQLEQPPTAADSRRVRTGTPGPPPQPILFPVTDPFCRLPPCLHCSIDRRSFTLETRCGYEYDRRGRHSVLRIFKGRRERTDTTRRAVLFQPPDPTSAEPPLWWAGQCR